MPVFSCGGMRYQHSWKDEEADCVAAGSQANLEALIQRALEAGINHFETARGYGTSEAQLGRVLPAIPRDRLIVQTKIGPRPTGDEFRRAFDVSLGNLRLARVDLLAVHGINNDDLLERVLAPGGTLDAADQLRREGRCRFVGFSTHGPAAATARAIETGRFDYVNLHWYFVNESNDPALAAAARQDMGVFIISPNDKGGKLYDPPDKLRRLCDPLTPMQFNDLYCLRRPEVHTLSVGASRPSDFDEHLAALARYNERESLGAAIAARIRAEMERALGTDWCRRWREGVPPWSEIPGHVNVHEILRLWNLATALDMEAYAIMRYNLLGQGGHWFPGNNAADMDRLDLAAALTRSPFADRIPGILRDAHRRFVSAPMTRLSS